MGLGSGIRVQGSKRHRIPQGMFLFDPWPAMLTRPCAATLKYYYCFILFISHPHSAIGLIHTRLDLIHTQLDLIQCGVTPIFKITLYVLYYGFFSVQQWTHGVW
jgi:hypothetical protein